MPFSRLIVTIQDDDNAFCYYFIPSATDSKDKGSSVEHHQRAAGFTTTRQSVYRGSKL